MLLLKAENVKKKYGERIVLDVEELSVYTNDRIGVIGANGAGKTTLFHIIEQAYEEDVAGVRIAPKVHPGFLKQDFSQLEPKMTVIQNAMAESVQEACVVKNVLAGLLFCAEDWNKRAEVLSGG